jgi:hypothetical protein
MSFSRDPDHPIIKSPWTYEIASFCYQNNLDDWRESYIDLILKKGTTIRRLRFLGPQDLEIGKGFPNPTHGMCILDVSARQLDGLKVHVDDFENNSGTVTFWAKDVIDLDDSKNA